MYMNMKRILSIVSLLYVFAVALSAADSTAVFYRIRLAQEIDKAAQRLVVKGLQKAAEVQFTMTNLNFEAITNLCNDPDYKNRVQLIASAKEPTMRLRLAPGVDILRQSKALIERYKKCIPVSDLSN